MAKQTTTKNSKFIRAAPEVLYRAFTNPEALETWQAPGEMTASVQNFNLKIGGGYQMSLRYPHTEEGAPGKSSDKEDRFNSIFTELTPYKKIVEVTTFDSDDPAFAGEMTMEVEFEAKDDGTVVTISFKNIPPGIDPKDNEKGTELSLQKLADYVK